MVRALDLQFGCPEFKSRICRRYSLVRILGRACKIACCFASDQFGFLTLLGPTGISAINNAEGKEQNFLFVIYLFICNGNRTEWSPIRIGNHMRPSTIKD